MENTETRMLMCRLSEDEQRMRGVEMADEIKKLDALDRDKRSIAEQIKDAEARVDRLAETVKHRQEERNVVCTMTPDFEADTMTIRRTDTGEIVHIRQLTHTERQPELPGMKVEAAAEKTDPGRAQAVDDDELIIINIQVPKKTKCKRVAVLLMPFGSKWACGWIVDSLPRGSFLLPKDNAELTFASKAAAFSEAQAKMIEHAKVHCPAVVEHIEAFTPEF